MSYPETCPSCKADLIGPPIPEGSRWLYGNATNFSRVLGHTDIHRDRTVSWCCPDCGHIWSRDIGTSQPKGTK